VSLSFGPAGAPQLGGAEAEAVAGILAQQLGESTQDQKKRIEDAKKNAKDLTGLVRHRKKPKEEAGGAASASLVNGTANGTKRKAEDAVESGAEEKRFKVDG
jgi:HAT1-interacting factor 1